jgi:hypothetical protein
MRNNGWRLADIAAEYGVTEGAVWKALNRAGVDDPRPTYRDLVPWDIDEKHRTTAVMARLRSITKQRRGQLLGEQEERLLSDWLEGLEENGLVVAYHPAAPPNSASRKGGFYYVPRSPADEWIIRQP